MASHTNANGVVQVAAGARILCVADVRGKLSLINSMAKRLNAQYVIHTGDFGFYDDDSLERMNEKTLKHVIQYSPLVPRNMGAQFAGSNSYESLKASIKKHSEPILSELPLFLNKTASFEVPVYTTWGACEDVRVLEKFRSGEYSVDNLHIVDEHESRLLEIGGLKLRLLGLGGAVVMHKLFDNGEGRTTIAGGQGTMWTTVLQMGELIETSLSTFDRSETRIFVSHMSPGREGLLAQLALALRADFTISAGLHFRYGTSYNDFSVNPNLDHFRNRLTASRTSFADVWETVKPEVLPIVQEPQKKLIDNVLQIMEMANSGERSSSDEVGFKNLWNFNLPDANFGSLILDVKDGQVASEQRSEGFNFDYRRAERRVKPLTSTQPVEQHAAQVPPPTTIPTEKVAPPAPAKEVMPPTAPPPSQPVTVKPTTPPPAEEPAPEVTTSGADKSATSPSKPNWGKPTAQIWIGQPPENIPAMFPPQHRENIRETRNAYARGSNFPYAIVYFHTVEEATAAIETLNHPKLKYGDDFDSSRGGGGGGSYGSRGGGSFSQGSYDSRKSGGSDGEVRGGFGRGGRGGRGGGGGGRGGAGSAGTFSSRGSGSGSPASGRGGSGRGRGGGPSTAASFSQQKDSGDMDINDDKPSVGTAAAPSGSDGTAETSKPLVSPAPAHTQPTSTTATTVPGAPSTAGESQA